MRRDERDPDDPGTLDQRRNHRQLHARSTSRGYAHSVEAWRDGRLVGGLYGVALGGAFFGESMFHRDTDASKVALVALVDRLRARGFALLDTQWVTPHLEQFGAIEIPQDGLPGAARAGDRHERTCDGDRTTPNPEPVGERRSSPQ